MGIGTLNSLVLRCYPGEDGQPGASTLYEDDGVTTAYEHGASALTPLIYTRNGDAVTIHVGATTGKYAGQPSARRIVVELPATIRATRATCDGKPLPIAYDPATFTNTVTVENRAIRKPTTIVVTAAQADFDQIHALAASRRIAGILGHPAADLKSALADPGLTGDQRDALLATAGIGYVAKNQGVYLYRGQIEDELFAPAGILDGDKATLRLTGQTRSVTGEPIEVPGTSITRRGVAIARPGQVSFTLGGQQYVLPETAGIQDELLGADNVAATAKVTVSGSEDGYGPEGAVDGVPGGYPNNKSQEWSAGQNEGAWLRLDWDTPQTVDRVLLFDRPNLTDQVTSGTVTFSDGTSLPVGPLPNDAKTGFELKFPAKTITWLKFTVTGVKPDTQNAGLSEIAVFRAK